MSNVPHLDVQNPADVAAVVRFARAETIDLVVVGPEWPLMLGVTDALEETGIKVFGPSQDAAELEGSKQFAKDLMSWHSVPTAKYNTFYNYDEAVAYVDAYDGERLVIKADGLAAGKGVVVAMSKEEAKTALHDFMVNRIHGDAGKMVVIEEFLAGTEVSIHVLCDGVNFALLPSAQDHKRVGNCDTGPNTGGMGAIAPVPGVGPQLIERISEEIIQPILDGMRYDGRLFKGCLYVGLMLTADGPKVLEFNVRFGDPETQVILPLLKGDLLEYLWACANGQLSQLGPVEQHPGYAVCVVMAAEGYPGPVVNGAVITGISRAEQLKGVTVIHSGTCLQFDGSQGELFTRGGRVLGVTGVDVTLEEARIRAYMGVDQIYFAGEHHRDDIGNRIGVRALVD